MMNSYQTQKVFSLKYKMKKRQRNRKKEVKIFKS